MRRSLSHYQETLEDDQGVNLTPLIDVVFVVLIMFILIAPLVNVDKVQLAPGKQTQKTPPKLDENMGIAIHVYGDNTFAINKVPISQKELLNTLKNLKVKSPHAIPQVYHDRKAYFETYQTIKTALEAAGFDEMDVILKAPE